MSNPKIVPFYGAEDPCLFRIEREAMDRAGVLVSWLDEHLGSGLILDVGGENGYTAQRLTRPDRTVVPLEPAAGMIPAHRRNPFVRGIAQELPFAADSFDTAYATWAYFFPQIGSGDPGLDELERVVRKGGKIAICDNAGSDAFCRLYNLDISSPAVWWEERGFSKDILTTSFDFKTLNDAEELLQFYWDNNGKAEGAEVKQTIEYKIVVYSRFVSRTGRGEREG